MPLNTIHGGVLERQAYRSGTRGSRGCDEIIERQARTRRPPGRKTGILLRCCRCRQFKMSIVILKRRGKWSEREREIGGDYRKTCEGLRKRSDERFGSISSFSRLQSTKRAGKMDIPGGMRMLRLLHSPILLLRLYI